MPNASNQEMLANVAADLEGAGAVWVVDYRGLTVKQTQALRRAVREADGSMKVYKNTIVRIALANAGEPAMDEILAGPSAFVFAGSDVAASAKVLRDFAKDNKDLEIKGGLMEGAVLSASEVEAIASLPSRDQLMAQIAGAISGVARGLATTISGVPRGLAQSIKQVAEQKDAA
jgi:large subunit ribosomal protein L10